jgi:hypothetical protein
MGCLNREGKGKSGKRERKQRRKEEEDSPRRHGEHGGRQKKRETNRAIWKREMRNR